MITKDQQQPANRYPTNVLALLTTSGFIAEFYAQCREHPTDIAAFDFLNDLYEQYFHKPKYTDYESFKTVRKRFVKQIKNRD